MINLEFYGFFSQFSVLQFSTWELKCHSWHTTPLQLMHLCNQCPDNSLHQAHLWVSGSSTSASTSQAVPVCPSLPWQPAMPGIPCWWQLKPERLGLWMWSNFYGERVHVINITTARAPRGHQRRLSCWSEPPRGLYLLKAKPLASAVPRIQQKLMLSPCNYGQYLYYNRGLHAYRNEIQQCSAAGTGGLSNRNAHRKTINILKMLS